MKKDNVLRVFTYLVEADVPFLCGKRTIENWNSKIDTKNKVLETEMDGEKKNRIRGRIDLEREILYIKGKEEELDTFKAIRKVHDLTNHKSADHLVIAYRNAGLMGPGTVKQQRM